MEIIKIWNNTLTATQARDVAARLDRGELMVYPTDTLYATGCDALNVKAVERLCRLQGIKPDKMCLSIVCHDISQASEYVRIDNRAFKLLHECTPGAFTFIFKVAAGSLPKAFKGRKQAGVRIPDCAAPLQVVEALGRPLLTASIHFEDDDYTVNPELIAEAYSGKADFMLLGDECGHEVSTIVDCTGTELEIVRQGKGKFTL